MINFDKLCAFTLCFVICSSSPLAEGGPVRIFRSPKFLLKFV